MMYFTISHSYIPVDPGVALEKQPVESVLVVAEAERCCPVPGMEQVVEAVLASGSGGALPQPRDSAQQAETLKLNIKIKQSPRYYFVLSTWTRLCKAIKLLRPPHNRRCAREKKCIPNEKVAKNLLVPEDVYAGMGRKFAIIPRSSVDVVVDRFGR